LEEKAATWFAKEDYQSMRRMDHFLIQAINSNTVPKEACTRGLEGRTPNESMKRRILMLDCVCGVLAEQDRQLSIGECHPGKIAEVYKEVAWEGLQGAVDRATSDAEAINDQICDEAAAKFFSGKTGNAIVLLPKKRRSAVRRLQRFIGRTSDL
jgi:hypothetical protein